MPITTVYDSERYLTSSVQIFKEWLQDYFSDIDIMDDIPELKDEYPISRSIVHIKILPGSDRAIGLGRSIGDGKKAKIFQPEIMVNFITTQELGGAAKVREFSEILKLNILKNGYLLAQAGLQIPSCGGLRELPKASLSIYYGGRQMVTWRCLVSY